jgi:hypothetical protein
VRELKQQLVSALLVIITVAATVAAAINLQQQTRFHLPDDGVTWSDQMQGAGRSSAVVALYVAPGSPGEKAGVHKGDQLISIADLSIDRALDVTAVLARLGAWKKVDYKVKHAGIEVTSNVIIGEAERDSTIFYQYAVGAVYLAIGLFVYFRRGSAPRALHFFVLCLASFILSTFHYSGKLNNFDKVIYLGNVVAGYLAPTLFLHFCFVFPEPQRWIRRRRWCICRARCCWRPSLASYSDGCNRPRPCSKCAGCSTACGWCSCAACIWRAALSSPRSCATPRIPSSAAS